MRLIIATVLVSAATVHADPVAELSSAAVTEEVNAVYPELRRCYVDLAGDVRGAGHLDVTLGIARHGSVFSVEVATPNLPRWLAKKIDTCVRTAVADLRFPVSRRDTTAVVPFFFQRTWAPGAGPQLSCWNPNGCH
jgi:hypothetical protein